MTSDSYISYFRKDIDRMEGYAPGEQLNIPELIKPFTTTLWTMPLKQDANPKAGRWFMSLKMVKDWNFP